MTVRREGIAVPEGPLCKSYERGTSAPGAKRGTIMIPRPSHMGTRREKEPQ
jgi:hypothetical protein